MTAFIKYRGAALANPQKTINDIPFNKTNVVSWMGGDRTVLTSYGVESMVDYNNASIQYPTRASLPDVNRLFVMGSVNGINVLNARPESQPNVVSPYSIPDLSGYTGRNCITYVLLAKAEATAYPNGQRTVLSFIGKNTDNNPVPMTRIQFNNNSSLSVSSRHSAVTETTTLATINNIPAGFNLFFIELNYVDKLIRISLNNGPMMLYSAYDGTSGPNALPAGTSGVLFGYLNYSDGTQAGTQYSGYIRELCVFNSKLADADIKDVLGFLGARRAYLNS